MTASTSAEDNTSRFNRLEWAPDSPALDAPPFRLLDYDLRIGG